MRILVVEDEVLIATMLEEWLEELGCTPLGPAGTVASALSFIKSEVLDAAILDLTLRGEDSHPVARALTAKGIPIIVASGRMQTDIAVDVVLTKPYDFDGLRSAVATVKSLPSAAKG